jgi:hypothetical protein
MAERERDGYDTDDYKDGTDPWKRANKKVNGLRLERMARVAIAPDMGLTRCPAKVAHAVWGAHRDVRQEAWARRVPLLRETRRPDRPLEEWPAWWLLRPATVILSH